MGFPRRLNLINRIASRRNSTVITYITGDRENVSTRIAPDALPVIYRHLRQRSFYERIDLFLYTRGGDVLTPWRLVHLIREFTNHFSVLIPYRAYSAGTLVCLGADEVVMGKMGELGPIDPSVVNAFNPQDPSNPGARIPVNVEDVYSYLNLVRDEAGLRSEPELARAFTLLATKIHPLALGNVHRNHLLVRSLARRLLQTHKSPFPSEKIQGIVDSLTEKLYAHNHMISRKEAAQEIGLPIVFADEQLEEDLWALFENYDQNLQLGIPFNPDEVVTQLCPTFEVPGGYIESVHGQHVFVFQGEVERNELGDKGQYNVNILNQGWRSQTVKGCTK
ncbi:MAG: hypothetical protein U1D96_09490 [Eubacteriales bacterium]|nr:hypothetical protein [Eubacteriales bacterium]MDQ7789342.1 hypothetical protein [Clostridia bacterium]MDZ4043698.1 hypothetical protein [Eubacteriales bacterium]MDZ7609704.1 hypothetical protein [Eubacteriales bacterium]